MPKAEDNLLPQGKTWKQWKKETDLNQAIFSGFKVFLLTLNSKLTISRMMEKLEIKWI